jgi:hypothetical protein
MLKQNLPRKVAVITIGLILVTALMENEQDITAVQRKWFRDSTDVGILSVLVYTSVEFH